jgi:bis(5'-nucleosidyl)-tetraphosphatase
MMRMIDDSWYHRPPNIPEETSAGGIVIRVAAEQIYIALVQEGRDRKYVLPKGRVEAGETIAQAAQREIAEEAGLHDLRLLADLGMQERLSFAKKTWKKIHYFLFSTTQIDGKPTDPKFRQAAAWFPLDQLPPIFWPDQKSLIDLNRAFIKTITLP